MEITSAISAPTRPTQTPPVQSSSGGDSARAPDPQPVRDLHALAERNLRSHQEVQVQILRQRSAEIQAHEHAHSAHAHGSRHYHYVMGPDGELHAVHGRVQINVNPAGTPEATIRKMDTLIRAAGAPADPSHGDRAVLALAKRYKRDAEMELSRRERRAEQEQAAERRKGREDLRDGLKSNPVRQAFRAMVDAYHDAGSLGAAPTHTFRISG